MESATAIVPRQKNRKVPLVGESAGSYATVTAPCRASVFPEPRANLLFARGPRREKAQESDRSRR